MNEATAIVPVQTQQQSIAAWRQATDIAGLVREFVLANVATIQGKRYPKVEAWQAIANAYGCVASSSEVERYEPKGSGDTGGYSAIGEVRRVSDSATVSISTGQGFVGDDEKSWSARPVFARRSMAQTRSISRACRAAFAFVIPIIDAGLQTTPAEEMDFLEAKTVNGASTAALKEKLLAVAPISAPKASPPSPRQSRMQIQDVEREEPPFPGDEHNPDTGEVVEARVESRDAEPPISMSFGAGKGKPISELTKKDLSWYRKVLAEGAENPEKARFRDDNLKKLAAIERELARR